MVFFILGMIDIVAGAILTFNDVNLVLAIGIAMVVKGAYSIVNDFIYILSNR